MSKPSTTTSSRASSPVSDAKTSKEARDLPLAEQALPQDTTPAVSPPPDGGFQAWLQVVGSFLLFFNGWGSVNAFGVFQTYYEKRGLSDPSAISWIGSIQAFLLLFCGVISGPLFDKGYMKSLIATGTAL